MGDDRAPDLSLLSDLAKPTGVSPLGGWQILLHFLPLLSLVSGDTFLRSARIAEQIAAGLGSPRAQLASHAWRVTAEYIRTPGEPHPELPGLRAQAARARTWGHPPLAWDSHRHVHLMPPVARIVAQVAREEGARWVRRARPPRAWGAVKEQALRVATLGSGLAYRGIAGPRWYVDITSQRPRLDAAGVALLATHGGVGEIGCHPGYVDDELRRSDSLVDERVADLLLITDPLLRTAFGSDTVRRRVP